MLISIVCPMYNESAVIDTFLTAILAVLEPLPDEYEIVCVNDGSTDDTLEKLLAGKESCGALRIINLSRNFGKEAALTAGLDRAKGDVAIPIDADLQDPPELIPQMIDKYREGFDVVLARRKDRTADSLADGPGCRSGHAHNANPGVTRGGRYGSDRILVQRTSGIRLCRRRHVQSGGSQTIAEQRQGRC